MAKKTEAQRFNKTQLHSTAHGQTVHRDYIAHAARWGFAFKFIKADMRVVDVGCGQECPLLNVLIHYPHPPIPSSMHIIDLNDFTPPTERPWLHAHPLTNVLDTDPNDFGPADVITCFEVIEHMDKEDGLELLGWLHNCLAPNGVLLLSTPCYDNRHKARNHIHEWTIDELSDGIIKADMNILRRWGTFMNLPDMRKEMERVYPESVPMMRELEEFYYNDVLSTLFAPLFPDKARNNVWLCTRRGMEPSDATA